MQAGCFYRPYGTRGLAADIDPAPTGYPYWYIFCRPYGTQFHPCDLTQDLRPGLFYFARAGARVGESP